MGGCVAWRRHEQQSPHRRLVKLWLYRLIPSSGSGLFPADRLLSPTITTLNTYFNGTHWKWTYRCQGCTSWTIGGVDGGIDPTQYCVFGWAYSATAVTTSSAPLPT
ncbi:hypothetical protein M407DRAFT_23379 [Tulasnella calospora MUT 4182]|uniref:Cellobiose dehydrogenase-like cytochrome domain-containing protein n=1 Tax=Tulasnella calospora MUT 4182 TaxID=1051891 RepID=A0A0C3M124_9AGAM|nr:hypothetical protein M407DRAFT_23379 [Tulasnella calospora MUT 4182]